MSSNAIATVGDVDWSVIDDVVAKGDLSKLTVEQRTKYYRMFCESLKLNPVTQPFQYMQLNGKLVLYATKGAADQLRSINHISLSITSAEVKGDDFCVTVRATTPGGRYDEDFASVTIAGLRGDQYHNAKLKAITKAKRRVTLSICGLGVNDETEVVTIPHARLLTPEELGAEVDEDGTAIVAHVEPPREIHPPSTPITQSRIAPLSAPRVKATAQPNGQEQTKERVIAKMREKGMRLDDSVTRATMADLAACVEMEFRKRMMDSPLRREPDGSATPGAILNALLALPSRTVDVETGEVREEEPVLTDEQMKAEIAQGSLIGTGR